MHAATLSALLVLVAGASPCGEAPRPGFVSVGPRRGIEPYRMAEGMGGGVAAADYDGDGDVDLFVPTGSGVPHQLYRNDGAAHFREVAGEVGLASLRKGRAALWFDYDADRDLDLLVISDDGSAPREPSLQALFRQGPDGTFEEVTAAAGLWFAAAARCRGGMCAADFNGDGYLDLYLTSWEGRDHLLFNEDGRRFRDVTFAAGLGITGPQATHFQPMAADFNRDGWMDLYVAVDYTENLLWINQGDGTFVDTAVAAGAAITANDMGMALGDYDGDGDLDIYTTNITYDDKHNVLLRNDSQGGVLAFTEVAGELGVAEGGWAWGTTMADVNNDGRLDLLVTNGFYPNADLPRDESKVFLQEPGEEPRFRDVSREYGFADLYWGSCLLAADLDRDGDADLVQSCQLGPLRVLQNRLRSPARRGRNHHYLTIQPRMDGNNYFAIGAEVEIEAAGRTTVQIVSAGASFLGQQPAEVHLGLGAEGFARRVTVRFPDGRRRLLEGVRANQVLRVEAPR